MSYCVDPSNGRVNSITDAKGNVTSYTYDAYGNVLSETSGNVTNTFTYANTGNLTAITHNGFSYSFGYDAYGNNTTTSIGSRTLITNTYGSDNYSLTKSTFGNGDVINYTYDDMGRVVEISNDENTLAKYIYNKKGAIAKVIDVASGINTEYWYNLSGVVLSTNSYNENREVVYYTSETTDTDGNSITVSAIGDATRVVTSGVDENDNSFVDNDGWTNTLTMDSFGRVTNKATVPSSGSAFTSTYTYLEGSADNSTTEFIEDIAVKYGDTDVITYTYEYDANGNITRESHNGVRKYVYTYDSLNQLVAVNNYVDNTYTTYEYDNGGNITRETVKNINPTNGDILSIQSDITYTYGDSEWKDLLTAYNGEAITYDQVGNPLNYRDGITFTWQNGRELATLTKDGNTISYTYNSNGIRTEKNNNGIVTKYFYDESNNLISLVQGDTQLVFYYDADGQADSFVVYSGEETARYYYVKNLQGDVTKIMSADGAVVANYYYGAYGEIFSITDAEGVEITDTSSVAFLNPLRYRSYVYDNDTGLYYLQSRYYDPIIKRFINADDLNVLFLKDNLLLGMNVFTYCYNAPVELSDPTGYQPNWAQVVMRYAKGTLAYKTFLKATQKGWYSNLFWIAGFFRTSDGVYHTRQDCWQQFFGYNNFYDWAFDLGTSMARAKFPFYSGSKEYIFWAWKGDYLNLGAGAELGIYSKLVMNGKSVGHWLAETKSSLSMTMKLMRYGKLVAYYKPSTRQWWITSFNPYYQNVKASSLSLTITINFSSNKKLFNNFYNKYGKGKYKSDMWTFDKKNYKATLVF